MSSTEGIAEMGRRKALLDAPIGERVDRFGELWLKTESPDTPEESLDGSRLEMVVLASSILAEVLTALVLCAKALESMAADSRSRTGGAL